MFAQAPAQEASKRLTRQRAFNFTGRGNYSILGIMCEIEMFREDKDMRWHEVTVHTTEEAIEMISNFIHELGAGGVSIEESGTLNKQRDTSLGQWYELPLNDIPEGRAVIKGYYSEGTDMEGVMEQLKQSVEQLAEYDIDTGSPVFELKDVDDEDWANAWKQYFKPIRISERLTIKPTWEDYTPGPEELIIELDPGMAFG